MVVYYVGSVISVCCVCIIFAIGDESLDSALFGIEQPSAHIVSQVDRFATVSAPSTRRLQGLMLRCCSASLARQRPCLRCVCGLRWEMTSSINKSSRLQSAIALTANLQTQSSLRARPPTRTAVLQRGRG